MATMAQAKDYFQRGLLKGFTLSREMGVCFVRCQFASGSGDFPLVDARTKTARHFKTMDAAIRAVEEIGFRVTVLEGVQ